MPVKKKEFTKVYDDLTKIIDVDDSIQRSVPINMNFIEEGFLIKDTGFVPFGRATDLLAHSPFNYKKKDGTSYILRGYDTKLQRYSELDKQWTDLPDCPTFTAGAEFGFVVYNDELYFGNAVESLYKFNGTVFTAYASAPKGNILEIFEDRLFITGVLLEPLTAYYSNVGVPTTFTGTDLVKPLGVDKITFIRNYYGVLMIFKEETIWKLTFVYNQMASLFVPKLEQQAGTYGAVSRKAVAWVENDLWFFTGKEVRAIGYTDNVTGVFGVNASVLSDQIKETLKLVVSSNYSKCVVAYNDRRFYLAVPLNSTTANVVFVSHLLYNKVWTKYIARAKSKINDFMFIDNVIYTTISEFPFGVIKWNVTTADTTDINNNLVVNE